MMHIFPKFLISIKIKVRGCKVKRILSINA